MITAATLPLLPDLAGRELDKTMVEVQEFETFVRRYQNMVFSVAARIIGTSPMQKTSLRKFLSRRSTALGSSSKAKPPVAG